MYAGLYPPDVTNPKADQFSKERSTVDIGTAIVAGLAATAIMTVLMYAARMMNMEMDMPRMLGLMFSSPDNTGVVYGLGIAIHFMMGAIFAIVYAALFEAFGISAGVLWGGVFGLGHGLIAGVAVSMMPVMHPRMSEGQVLAAPGPFAVKWGGMMPAGIIFAHIVFGIVVGAVY